MSDPNMQHRKTHVRGVLGQDKQDKATKKTLFKTQEVHDCLLLADKPTSNLYWTKNIKKHSERIRG